METIKLSVRMMRRAVALSARNTGGYVEGVYVYGFQFGEIGLPRKEFGYKRIYRKGRFIKLERI